jgi:DNA-binding protein H-NS
MPKRSLSSMTVEELLKLRDDVGKELSRKANELKSQLARLGSEVAPSRRGRGSALKGRTVPIKYRDKAGNTWAGRGARPRWLVAAIKEGKKLEDFVVEKTVASRKASPSKKRRAKR